MKDGLFMTVEGLL